MKGFWSKVAFRMTAVLLLISMLFLGSCKKKPTDENESTENITQAIEKPTESQTNETPPPEPKLDMVTMTFLSTGNGAIKDNDKAPYELDETTGIINVKHGGTDSLYNSAKYCVLLHFKTQGIMSAKYKYVRVIYSAKNPEGADSVALKIRDNAVGGASDVTLATITEDTDGFGLSNTEQMAVSSLSRLLDMNYDTWLFETALEGAEYCIKGVYFFQSFEEAQKLTVEIADKLIAEEQKKAAEEAASKSLVAMDFSESGNAEVKTNAYTHDADSVVDGVINVTRSAEAIYSTTRYMTMPMFKAEKAITVQHKYIRILYSVENPKGLSSVPMLLRATASGETVTVLSGAYNIGGFALTNTVTMSNGIVSAFVLRNDVAVIFDTNSEGGTFRIKGIYFFATKEEADAFSIREAVSVKTPNGLKTTDSTYPALTFGTDGSGAYTNTKNTKYSPNPETKSIRIDYSGETVKEWDSTRYLIKVKFPSAGILTDAYKYIRVAYKAANPAAETSVDMVLRTDGTGENDLVLATVSDATNGFVLSDATELNEKLLSRFVNGEHNSLFFKTSADGGEYYIYGIFFYDSQEKAENAKLSDMLISWPDYEKDGAAYTPAGTAEDPILISNASDLMTFVSRMDSADFAGKYIKLTADIDLNPGWTASATEPTVKWVWKYNCFTGVFDGGGHTVSGIYLNAKDSKGGDVDYVGIFGGFLGANKSVEIKNLTIVNSYVCGGKQNGYVGALLGITSGGGTATTAVYSNLYVDAIVESTKFRVGGMVGYVQKGTVLTFENCVFAGKVKTSVTGGEANVGGFVGRIEPSTTCTINFRTCAFYGMVTSQTATDYIGGFVGVITNAFEENDVVFDNCICAGRIEAPAGAKNSGLFCKVSNPNAVLVMKNCLYVDCFFIDGIAQDWNAPVNAENKTKITETNEVTENQLKSANVTVDREKWSVTDNTYPLPTALVDSRNP